MQRRDLVVEGVAALVEAAQLLRQDVFQEGAVDLARARLLHGNGELLDEIEQPPRIAVGEPDQALARAGVELDALEGDLGGTF